MALDAVGKRQFVVAILFILEAAKLHNWITTKTVENNFIVKWSILEIIFLFALWKAKVPRLTFSLLATLFLSILVTLLNITCFIGLPWGATFLRLKFMPFSSTIEMVGLDTEPVNNIVGSKEHLLRDIQNNTHLHGSYTVKIRPWSSAILNPEQKALCLPTSHPMPNSSGLSESLRHPLINPNSPAKVFLPILVTGHGPWIVTIERDGKLFKEIEIKGQNKALMDLSIEKVGEYRISKIIDGNGSEGKVTLSTVMISSCPQARLDGLVVKHGIEMCNSVSFPVKLWINKDASSPLSVTFDVVSDSGKEQIVSSNISLDQPSKINGQFKLFTFNLKGTTKYSQFLLRVSSIQDGKGLIHNYGAWDNGDAALVNLLPPPKVSWLQTGDRLSPKLKYNQPTIDLSLFISGTPPFTVKLLQPDGVESAMKFEATTNGVVSFPAKQVGTYRLLSVEDSLCVGVVDPRQEVTVQLVHPPSLQIDAKSIKSPCKGDLGLEFDFLLSGEGPWTLIANQTLNGKSKERITISVPTARYKYIWRPNSPGTFDLGFEYLLDSNYNFKLGGAVPLKNLRYSQDILPLPKAFIASSIRSDLYTCLGQQLLIPIEFEGSGPWKLEYSLSQPNGSVISLNLDASSKIDLSLVDFSSPGRYLLSLVSVTDNNGCVANLESQTIPINVFPTPPTASFTSDAALIRDGTNDLIPLNLNANKFPLYLTLRHEREGVKNVLINSMSKGIELSEPGVWELVGLKDDFCKGQIGERKLINVTILPRPTAEFGKSLERWTCRTEVIKPVKVVVAGNGMISLGYSVQYALDEAGLNSSRKEIKLTTGVGPIFTISPSSLAPGYYRYELLTISDEAFPERQINGIFVQNVLPDPAPRVASLNAATKTFCFVSEQSTPIGELLIDFTGSEIPGMSPFSFEYDVLQGTKLIKSFKDSISSKSFPTKFEVQQGVSEPGFYNLRVSHVKNAHGCVWNSTQSQSMNTAIRELTAISLELIEKPQISVSLPDKDICVGDVVRFNLKGTGPWIVKYTLKGSNAEKEKTDTVSVNRLSVLVAEPGTLQINSVCNRFCCADITDPLTFTIHSLPSAIISDGIQYLHEGEVTEFNVNLTGEAPFTFVYQRIDENNGQAIETVEVKDVQTNSHSVKVVSGGTYRVIQVKDRYCKYPKQ